MSFIERLTQCLSNQVAGAGLDQAFTGERASPRYRATLHVRYDGGGPLVARRGNLGIGGFCFEGERLYAVGSRLELRFQLPGFNRSFHATGEVLGHSTRNGYLGVRGRFVELGFEAERALARWIDSQSPGCLQAQPA